MPREGDKTTEPPISPAEPWEEGPGKSLRQRLEANDCFAKAAIIVWIIIIAVIAIRLPKIADHNDSIPRLLYDAGTHWMNSQPLYEQEGAYRYSPGVAAVLSLFARLPLHAAAYCGLALNLLCFFAGFLYWLRVALPQRRDRHYRALLLLIATPLIVGNFNNMQANPICLGAMFALVAAVLRKRWLIAALAIAVATSLKVYPLAIGLVLLVLYPRRLWLAMLVGLAIAAVVPFLMANPEYVVRCYREWVLGVINDDRSTRPLSTSYRDVALLWRVYAGHFHLLAYQGMQLIGALAIGVVALRLWFSKKIDAEKCHFLLGLVLCWIMLLGPSTESATYMMMGPLAAWLLLESCFAHWRPWIIIAAAIGYGLLLLTAIVATTPFGRAFITYGPQPIATLFVLVALINWYNSPLPSDIE